MKDQAEFGSALIFFLLCAAIVLVPFVVLMIYLPAATPFQLMVVVVLYLALNQGDKK
jgi:hypothetical protein